MSAHAGGCKRVAELEDAVAVGGRLRVGVAEPGPHCGHVVRDLERDAGLGLARGHDRLRVRVDVDLVDDTGLPMLVPSRVA